MNKKAVYYNIMAVRDYECDLEGIVNNSNYMRYMEHTRHCFLKAGGMDFAELHRQGIDPVVTRAEIDYLLPLTSGDLFVSAIENCGLKGSFRIIFKQIIYKIEKKELIPSARGLIHAALIKDKKPYPAKGNMDTLLEIQEREIKLPDNPYQFILIQ
ncbi:acyl-CoA thioesterase [Spirochaetia bacterium 38H-sp]|uniref:Acyl-CoA thioesterase n=1 Tax=Rarispira pelagica TaxID=3141764 RepID=A0ABU9U8F7_9SPIR